MNFSTISNELLSEHNYINQHIPIRRRLNLNEIMQNKCFKDAVLEVYKSYGLLNNPYTQWINQTSKTHFLESQLPFRYAVEEFSCALSACLAKIPTLNKRMALAENIAEEHGHCNYTNSHKYTFIEYLLALGAENSAIELLPHSGILAFNQSIKNYCLVTPYQSGAAALGMIEYLYIDISGEIANLIIRNEWVKPLSQKHYAVHEKLDVAHSQELFDIVQDEWDNVVTKAQIAEGLIFGAEIFNQLYSSMTPQADVPYIHTIKILG